MTDENAVGEDKIFTLDEVAKKINIIEIRFILANRFPHLEIIDKSEYDRLKRLEEENNNLNCIINALRNRRSKTIALEITLDEIARLKRLRENVKNKINELKIAIDIHDDETCNSLTLLENMKNLELLESLDK